MCDKGPNRPASMSSWARRLGGDPRHLGGVEPHRLLHQEGIAQIDQIVGDPRHLPVSAEREDEVWTGRRQHIQVVGEGRRTTRLDGALGRELRIRVMDRHQLHVRHGAKVAQVAGIMEPMPVADPCCGDPHRHAAVRPGRAVAGSGRAVA